MPEESKTRLALFVAGLVGISAAVLIGERANAAGWAGLALALIAAGIPESNR